MSAFRQLADSLGLRPVGASAPEGRPQSFDYAQDKPLYPPGCPRPALSPAIGGIEGSQASYPRLSPPFRDNLW